jgi:hypothetical protein
VRAAKFGLLRKVAASRHLAERKQRRGAHVGAHDPAIDDVQDFGRQVEQPLGRIQDRCAQLLGGESASPRRS